MSLTGNPASTKSRTGCHGNLYGFQGEKVGRANFREFLALQHCNHSTERWQWGDLRWILSVEGHRVSSLLVGHQNGASSGASCDDATSRATASRI